MPHHFNRTVLLAMCYLSGLLTGCVFAKSVSSSQGDETPTQLGRPFVLSVGQTKKTVPEGVTVTLRSSSDDSGCLSPDDCSVMLFKGSIVLSFHGQSELHAIDAMIAPDKPFILAFDNYSIALNAIQKFPRNRLQATFTVMPASMPNEPHSATSITDDDALTPAVSTPTEVNSRQQEYFHLLMRSAKSTNSDAIPIWITNSSLSNSGWTILFHSALPFSKLEVRLSGETIWSSMSAYDREFHASFADLPEQASIEVRGTTLEGNLLGPYKLSLDIRAERTKNDINVLRMTPGAWGSFKDKYVYFGHLFSNSCGIREVRYSINDESLSQRLALPECEPTRTHGSPSDNSDVLHLPEKPKLVAVQLVFADGSVSNIVVHRREAY